MVATRWATRGPGGLEGGTEVMVGWRLEFCELSGPIHRAVRLRDEWCTAGFLGFFVSHVSNSGRHGAPIAMSYFFGGWLAMIMLEILA